MLTDAAEQRTSLGRDDVSAIADSMFVLMGETLASGKNVKLTGFGSLQVRARAERIGRNPRTGTEHVISSRHTVVFTPSTRLRQVFTNAEATGPSPREVGGRS